MSFEIQNIALFVGIGVWMIATALWLYASFRDKARELGELRSFCTTLQSENMELSVQKAKLEAELVAQKEGNAALKADLEEQSQKLELKLNAIMEQHLEKKLQKLDETSTKSLETLLKPFKENLETFKKSVENSQEHSTKKFSRTLQRDRTGGTRGTEYLERSGKLDQSTQR